MTLAESLFEKPRLRRNVSRSSSVGVSDYHRGIKAGYRTRPILVLGYSDPCAFNLDANSLSVFVARIVEAYRTVPVDTDLPRMSLAQLAQPGRLLLEHLLAIPGEDIGLREL